MLTKAVFLLIVPGILAAIFCAQPADRATGRDFFRRLLPGLAAAAAAVLIARAMIPASVPTRYDLPRAIVATIQTIATRSQAGLIPNLLAPIFSPGRGLLFFAPLLLVGPLAGIKSGREWKGYAIAAIWSLAVVVVLEAATIGNEGWSLSWGPRRLLPVLSLFLIAGLPLLDRLVRSQRRWIKFAAGLLLAAGVVVQLGGVLVSRALVRQGLDHEIGDFFSDRLVWDVRYSPIFYTWKLLLGGVRPDLAIFRLNETGVGWGSIVFVILAGAGIALAVVGLVRSVSPGLEARRTGLGVLVGVLVCAAPIFLLRAGQNDPAQFADGRFSEAAAFLDSGDLEGGVLIVDHYLSPFWLFLLNHNGDWHGPWASLPLPGESFGPQKLAALHAGAAGLSAYESIWVVSENSEFQVSEGFDLVADLLDGYTLVDLRGFSGRRSGTSLVFFHYQSP